MTLPYTFIKAYAHRYHSISILIIMNIFGCEAGNMRNVTHSSCMLFTFQLAGRREVSQKHYDNFREACIAFYGSAEKSMYYFTVMILDRCRYACILLHILFKKNK